MKLGLAANALGRDCSLGLILGPGALAQQQQPPTVPDAPAPQNPGPLTDVSGPITPGIGAGNTPAASGTSSTSAQQPAPGTQPPANQAKEPDPDHSSRDARGGRRRDQDHHVTSPERELTLKCRLQSRIQRESWCPVSPGATSKSMKTALDEPLKVFTVDAFPALDRVCYRSEPDRRRDGQGERVARRHPGRADAL